MPGATAQGNYDELIAKHAAIHGVPESLVRRVIHIESRGNPAIVSKGNYGLMQIRLGTARAMGYQGSAEGLLDPDTNMTYAVKYLAGAYRAAGCSADGAVRNYQRGYYGSTGSPCGQQPAGPQLAGQSKATSGSAVRAAARREPDAETTPSADVLKPKAVRTVTITRPNAAPSRPVAAIRMPDAVPVPAPRPQAAAAAKRAATDRPAAAATEATQAEATGSLAATQSAAPRRSRIRKKVEPPLNLVAFLKKLVTPEPATRTRKRQSQW